MKHALLLLTAALTCAGCASSRKAGTNELHKSDSIRTEVRHETTYVPDTFYIEIPAQSAERTTCDSTSLLENDYAISLARINTDGTLFHTLQAKPQRKPVEVQVPVERHDSIVYADRYREVPVTVEKKPSRMESIKQKAFWPMLLALLLAFIYIFRKPIGALLKR